MKKQFILITTILLLMTNLAFADMSADEWGKLREQAATGSAIALTQIQNGAQSGDPAAEVELALLYDNGQGVPQDYGLAAAWYRKAADQGYADAQYNLGVCYAMGQGVPQDYGQAAAWFQKTADQGYAVSQYALGVCYAKGQGVPQDYGQAAAWYRKAAEQGNADAQSNLGFLYDNGQGVPQDYGQAAAWYRKAADQGNADAQSNLGFLYDNGQGVPQDYGQAAAWFRKAADQGNALAQNNLGALYKTGQGLIQSSVIAYALYNVSATNDSSADNPATKNREELAANMTNKEITVAQRLTAAMMQPHNLLVALDHYESHPMKGASTQESATVRPSGSVWPARPARVPGETTCNTRCVNGSCWRTYDSGRHKHFVIPPTMDPFTNEMTFQTPPC